MYFSNELFLLNCIHGNQLVNGSGSVVKDLKKDQVLISYLDQFFELGVFFGVRINHSALLILLCPSEMGNKLDHIYIAEILQQLLFMK